MPTYCYRGKDGDLVEVAMTYARKCEIEDGDGSIMHEGRRLRRDIEAEHGGTVGSSAGWPMLSDAAAVHPDLVPQVKGDLARHGVHVDFTSDGRPRFDSAAHRRAALRRLGYHDRQGYD